MKNLQQQKNMCIRRSILPKFSPKIAGIFLSGPWKFHTQTKSSIYFIEKFILWLDNLIELIWTWNQGILLGRGGQVRYKKWSWKYGSRLDSGGPSKLQEESLKFIWLIIVRAAKKVGIKAKKMGCHRNPR